METLQRLGRAGVIGLLGIQPDSFDDPYFSQILHGVQSEAFEAGYEVVLLETHTPIFWHTVDAVLLVSDHRALLADKPAHLPCISLLYLDESLPSVVVDDYEGVRQATERLIDLGHERIAYLSLAQHRITRLRIAGYQRALGNAGITALPAWLRDRAQQILQRERNQQRNDPRVYMREWGYRSIQNWLRTDWKNVGCTALLAQNDHAAVGALAAFQEAGMHVPADVSLVGFDDSALCETTAPTLSSIAAPLFEVGAVGVRSLLREFDRAQSQTPAIENAPETVVLPARFQARDSVGTAP